MLQVGYRPQLRMPQPTGVGQMAVAPGEVGFDGKMLRKTMARKTVDYNPSVVKYLEVNINSNLIQIFILFLNLYIF